MNNRGPTPNWEYIIPWPAFSRLLEINVALVMDLVRNISVGDGGLSQNSSLQNTNLNYEVMNFFLLIKRSCANCRCWKEIM